MRLDSLFRWLLVQFHLDVNSRYVYICKCLFFFFKGKTRKRRQAQNWSHCQDTAKCHKSMWRQKSWTEPLPWFLGKQLFMFLQEIITENVEAVHQFIPENKTASAASHYFAGKFMLTCRDHSRACHVKTKVLSRRKHCEAKSVTHPVTAHGNAVTALWSLRGTKKPTNK